jgi:hypothetical protein
MDGKELFKAWIANSNYQALRSPGYEFELMPYNLGELKNTLINDACKFSCSSLETAIGITKNVKISKSTAWILIKLYYSAFYAAHSMLRMFGRSFSQIDPSYSRIIENNYLVFNAVPKKIENGMYNFVLDETRSTLTSQKYSDSHSDLWNVFYDLLQSLENNIRDRSLVPITNSELLLLTDYIQYLRKMLNKDSGAVKHNWLSIVRNNVNYQHQYGVWYPQGSRFSNEKILLISQKWNYDPIAIYKEKGLSDIEDFSLCCISIVAMVSDISRHLGRQISKKSCYKIVYSKLYEIVNV